MLAGNRRNILIVADRPQHAAERRMAETLQHHERRSQHGDHDAEEQQVELLRRQCPSPWPGNARDAVRAVGQPDLVGGGDAHGFGKPQCDNGKIVSSQPRGDQRDAGAGCRGGKRAGRNAERNGEPALVISAVV